MATDKHNFGGHPVIAGAGPVHVLVSMSQARNPALLNPFQTL